MTTTTTAIPVTHALHALERLAVGPRLRPDERLALEAVLADVRDRYGLTRACPTCRAEIGQRCRAESGRDLRGGATHATRRTLDLDEVCRG